MKLDMYGLNVEWLEKSREVKVTVRNNDGDLIASFTLSTGEAAALEAMLRFVYCHGVY